MSQCFVLDLSKKVSSALTEDKNVQPPKEPSYLHSETISNTRSSSEVQRRLNETIKYFEIRICQYDGDDPLQPRYDFGCWIEQNCQYLNSETIYVPFLEDTIVQLRDDLRYKQDVRFIRLLIKYIELQPNPVEFYPGVFNEGLGTMCASFYISWAEALDRRNDFKLANKIYDIGIGYLAQPIEDLKRAQATFHLNLGRRMLGCQTNRQESSNRQALCQLRVLNALNTGVANENTGSISENSLKNSNLKPTVCAYQNENYESRSKEVKLVSSSSVLNKSAMSGAQWNNRGSASCIAVQRQACPSSVPKFQIHEDGDVEARTQLFTAESGHSNILKRKDNQSRLCPLALFDPPDPKSKPMYPKHKVYIGGCEFQLEELRAISYNKIYEAERMKRTTVTITTEFPESEAGVSKSDSVNPHRAHLPVTSCSVLSDESKTTLNVLNSDHQSETIQRNKTDFIKDKHNMVHDSFREYSADNHRDESSIEECSSSLRTCSSHQIEIQHSGSLQSSRIHKVNSCSVLSDESKTTLNVLNNDHQSETIQRNRTDFIKDKRDMVHDSFREYSADNQRDEGSSEECSSSLRTCSSHQIEIQHSGSLQSSRIHKNFGGGIRPPLVSKALKVMADTLGNVWNNSPEQVRAVNETPTNVPKFNSSFDLKAENFEAIYTEQTSSGGISTVPSDCEKRYESRSNRSCSDNSLEIVKQPLSRNESDSKTNDNITSQVKTVGAYSYSANIGKQIFDFNSVWNDSDSDD